MSRVYPELPRGAALALLGEIRERKGAEGQVSGPARFSHPRAAASPTGGHAVSEDDLRQLSERINGVIRPWIEDGPESVGTRDFDLALGKALHEELGVSPAMASREGMWSFLTLVVFPHLLVFRFPSTKEERALGCPRNVLRRVWLREELLGEVIHRPHGGLREDEYVQILERTALARTPSVAKLVAREVLKRDSDGAREGFTRELAKEVVRQTGPLLLDALDESQLTQLVADCAARVDGRS